VTFFVGENGSGKSTLLEAITRKCGIYIWQGMQRPRFNASPYEKGLFKTIAIEWIDGKKVTGFFPSMKFRYSKLTTMTRITTGFIKTL